MAITKYDPFAEMAEFPAGLRLFQDAVSRLFSEPPAARPWAPAVDILETENELVLKADVPDVEMKDINIQIENGTLTLQGERKFEKMDERAGYHRIERSYGSFVRCFSLPDTVDTDKVQAEYKNGVLSVKLAKKEVAKPKKIQVQVSKS
jgi:HSP20 family protein